MHAYTEHITHARYKHIWGQDVVVANLIVILLVDELADSGEELNDLVLDIYGEHPTDVIGLNRTVIDPSVAAAVNSVTCAANHRSLGADSLSGPTRSLGAEDI